MSFGLVEVCIWQTSNALAVWAEEFLTREHAWLTSGSSSVIFQSSQLSMQPKYFTLFPYLDSARMKWRCMYIFYISIFSMVAANIQYTISHQVPLVQKDNIGCPPGSTSPDCDMLISTGLHCHTKALFPFQHYSGEIRPDDNGGWSHRLLPHKMARHQPDYSPW